MTTPRTTLPKHLAFVELNLMQRLHTAINTTQTGFSHDAEKALITGSTAAAKAITRCACPAGPHRMKLRLNQNFESPAFDDLPSRVMNIIRERLLRD
jgi:hypothetical protein